MWPQANVKRITIRQTPTPNKKATTNNRQTTKHYYKYVNTYTNAWMISSKSSNKKAKTRKTPTKSSLEKAKWLQASSSVAVDYLSFKCKLLFSSCVLFFFFTYISFFAIPINGNLVKVQMTSLRAIKCAPKVSVS